MPFLYGAATMTEKVCGMKPHRKLWSLLLMRQYDQALSAL